jgi:thioredoxin-like negative regulator of GroEL
LIYFYTTWCGGCKRFSPYWDVLVNKYSDKFTCIKIDVDDSKYKKLAREFNIRGIPQVYIYDRVRKKKISLRVSTYMNPEIDKYYEKYYQK